MIIEKSSRLLRWIYPHALWRMNPEERAVYLTFDDGPIPEATPFVLDTLAQHRAKATFFIVADNAQRHPELLERVKNEGHRVGNHSFHHLAGHQTNTERYLSDIEAADKLLQTDLFRPPHGWMRIDQYRQLRQRFRIVMWDLVTRDYSSKLNAEQVFENVCRYARPGSIITFHDSLKSIDKLHTALPKALTWLKNEGYEFRTFD